MNVNELSKREYLARINRVIEYIDLHLDETLNLTELAKVACFSPFHFHRIFSFLEGETPVDYIKRRRLEVAARKLLANPQSPISEIATQCGFNSDSVFSRAFKSYFKVTANQFRTTESYLRKIDQWDSKNNQSMQEEQAYLRGSEINLKLNAMMTKKFEVKELPELNLICCRHTGEFHLIELAFAKLIRWAAPRGLMGPNTRTVTVYHDDPNITEIEKLRQSAGIVLEKGVIVKPEGEISLMTLRAGKYLVGGFEISVYEFTEAWGSTCSYMFQNGLLPGEGCPYELYFNNHEEHPEGKFILDICLPVKPM